VVARVLAGETALFEILMRRYNQRLYRMSRMILRNDGEAEDVMQDAYVRAYEHLNQFAGKAAFSTWLTRIAIHEALARKRRRGRMEELDALPENGNLWPYSNPLRPVRKTAPLHRKLVNCWNRRLTSSGSLPRGGHAA